MKGPASAGQLNGRAQRGQLGRCGADRHRSRPRRVRGLGLRAAVAAPIGPEEDHQRGRGEQGIR